MEIVSTILYIFLCLTFLALIVLGARERLEPKDWICILLFIFLLPVWFIVKVITYTKKMKKEHKTLKQVIDEDLRRDKKD